jgi:very-short-patch-repair endonuclease
MKNPIDRLYEEAEIHLVEMVCAIADHGLLKCESPIEKILLQAIQVYHLISNGSWAYSMQPPKGIDAWFVEPQKQIGSYRVDFLITHPSYKIPIVVECDGHDFHERTREQAERDRSRDRSLTASGYRVIRFTGREIWRDPWSCAAEIDEQFISMLHEEAGY